jgi:hypothetical protein
MGIANADASGCDRPSISSGVDLQSRCRLYRVMRVHLMSYKSNVKTHGCGAQQSIGLGLG